MRITIKQPCGEDWARMGPRERGRFCASCEREVIDLTRATDQELMAVFNATGETPCARFHPHQLDRWLNDPKEPRKGLFPALALGSLVSLLTACTAGPEAGPEPPATVVVDGDRTNADLQERATEDRMVRVTGRLVDKATGAPVNKGYIGHRAWSDLEHTTNMVTGADGRFDLTVCMKDSTDLYFASLGGEPFNQAIIVGGTSDRTIDIGDIALDARDMVMVGMAVTERRATWREKLAQAFK